MTNARILEQGIAEKTANAILIKLNQIGTLSETRQTIRIAKSNQFRCVMSHRSVKQKILLLPIWPLIPGVDKFKQVLFVEAIE